MLKLITKSYIIDDQGPHCLMINNKSVKQKPPFQLIMRNLVRKFSVMIHK